MKNRGSIKAINRLEKRLEEFARLLLVRCHALSFLVFFSAYVFVLWYSGSLSIIDPSYQNNDRSELANVALALTGIAALVGASLATYELQRSTTHARRAAQATFWLELEGRFMSPELREAEDALREIWTEANNYFNELVKNYATVKIMHEIDGELRNMLKQYLEGRNKEDNKAEFLSRHIAHELNHLRNTNQHLCHVLLRNCEIFETIGVMWKRGYIDVEDVNRRFNAADRMHISFKHHLAEEGIFFGDARPFSNAMDLAKELKKNDS